MIAGPSRAAASPPPRGPVPLLLPRARTGWEELARGALFFLLRQWQLHFPEAVHVLPFPPEQGFRGAEPLHAGDVFERALLADALCDADEEIGQLGAVIDAEVDYLLGARRTTGIGAWSYFPDLPELPPDADDLAQVMTLLLRRGRGAEVRALCEPALAVLLTDGAHEDGSFETWILPREGRSAEQALQAEWVEKAWGSGADPEVVANLLHALSLYDPRRFADRLAAGAAFLVRRQEAEGWWRSSWYWGPFYGTWVALRVLTRGKQRLTSRPEVAAALAWLCAAQRDDGGWGWGAESDALSTALALLALTTPAKAGTPPPVCLAPALAYLQATQEADGAWPAAPFIRMDLGRATGQVHQVLSYASRTLTAGFVLKAALAAHRLSFRA